MRQPGKATSRHEVTSRVCAPCAIYGRGRTEIRREKAIRADSRAKGREPERELRVIDARDIPRIDDRTKVEMLRVFADGCLPGRLSLLDGRQSPPKTASVAIRGNAICSMKNREHLARDEAATKKTNRQGRCTLASLPVN